MPKIKSKKRTISKKKALTVNKDLPSVTEIFNLHDIKKIYPIILSEDDIICVPYEIFLKIVLHMHSQNTIIEQQRTQIKNNEDVIISQINEITYLYKLVELYRSLT